LVFINLRPSAAKHSLIRHTKHCLWCEKDFTVPNNRKDSAKFCSRQCHYAYATKAVDQTCPQCGTHFKRTQAKAKNGQGIYCSRTCAFKSYVTSVSKICPQCSQEFRPFQHQIKKGYGKYCSHACRDKARTTRVKCVCPQCDKAFEVRQYRVANGETPFCSRQCCDFAKKSKVFNPEERFSSEYEAWRREVLKRDSNTCQKCGACAVDGAKIRVHHVLPWKLFPESRFDVTNGLTLCEDCHYDVHRVINVNKVRRGAVLSAEECRRVAFERVQRHVE
jgi:hypothetical protein